VGSSAGRVKTKTIELVFSASPLSTQHKDIRSKVGLESGQCVQVEQQVYQRNVVPVS
jgi:hypothetical protein